MERKINAYHALLEQKLKQDKKVIQDLEMRNDEYIKANELDISGDASKFRIKSAVMALETSENMIRALMETIGDEPEFPKRNIQHEIKPAFAPKGYIDGYELDPEIKNYKEDK